MGKASRWIRNLLLGKKEDKNNNKDGGGAATSPPCNAAIISSSQPWTAAFTPPTPRRRWSFRRSSITEKVVNHKSCRSFDSIVASRLVSEALSDYAVQQQNHTNILALPPPKAATKMAAYRVSRVVEVAAATKIQSAFRSYLARKALFALRGLVKLQALVRGHLVRKRTTTMVRCMKALVSIQVRARFQRIQMVDDPDLWSRLSATSNRGLVVAHDRCLRAPQCDHSEKPEHFGRSSRTGTNMSYRQSSRRHSIDSLPLTRQSSMRLQNKRVGTVSTSSSQHHEPNYMTRTKSSRAKTRSQSEPKQRPSKPKRENRQTSTNIGLGGTRNRTQGNQTGHEGWLTKLHRSSKSINDIEFDTASTSTSTNGSSYFTTLYTYETAANLY